MPKTYEPSLLASSPLFQVRLHTGDNVTGKMIMDDAEITFYLSQEANVYMAAATVADQLALRIATSATSTDGKGPVSKKKIGGTEITYATASGRSAKDFEALSKALRARGRTHQIPYAGGISVADKDVRRQDTDRPTDGIRRGQFDYPGGLSNIESD